MSRVLIDLTGSLFGRLIVVRREGCVQRNTKQPTWLCRCSCGVEKVVMGAALRGGTTSSCGCLQRETTSKRFRKHKAKGTPEHNSWRGMRERCDNPNNNHYAQYGGRGITYCERWKEFTTFLSDMGARPPGCTLDRIDNNGNYGPDNCRWSSPSCQSRNSQRTVHVTYNGKTMCIKDWAKVLGITDGALSHRIKVHGVSIAMTMPRYSKPVNRRWPKTT